MDDKLGGVTVLNSNNCEILDVDPNKVWSGLAGFAEYAFNKSHAVAYSFISYKTAEMWVEHKMELFEMLLNHGSKSDFNLVMDNLKSIGFKFVYPTLKYMTGEDFKLNEARKEIYLPGGSDKNFETFNEFFFGFDEIGNRNFNSIMILKGIGDSITKDRAGLAVLVNAIYLKDVRILENYPEEIHRLDDLLNALKIANVLKDEKIDDNGNRTLVLSRMRGKDLIIKIRNNRDSGLRREMLQYDLKYFGSARPGILSYMPYINTEPIENKLNRIQQNMISRGFVDKNSIYFNLKDALNDYMREYYWDKPEKSIFEDQIAILKDFRTFGRDTKLVLEFADKSDIFYVKNQLFNNAIKGKNVKKNALVNITMEYSPFIKRRDNTFVYDFDITKFKIE